MTSSTLSQNGQTTIPAKVREFLHIGPSDKLIYRFEGDRVVLETAPSSTEALYGSLKSNRKPPTREEIETARAVYAARKFRR